VIDQRNRLRNKLEHEWLPALKAFTISSILEKSQPKQAVVSSSFSKQAPEMNNTQQLKLKELLGGASKSEV